MLELFTSLDWDVWTNLKGEGGRGGEEGGVVKSWVWPAREPFICWKEDMKGEEGGLQLTVVVCGGQSVLEPPRPRLGSGENL